MKKKICDQFEYDGLGFPVILINCPIVDVRGVVVPDVDYNILQKSVLLGLCRKPVPFTGNEVKFIRQYLQMNYSEFAKQFGVTHASIIHWEDSANHFAKIQPTTELCIRLHVLDVLHANNKLFRETFRNFDYQEFKVQKNRTADEPLTIDSKTMEAVH